MKRVFLSSMNNSALEKASLRKKALSLRQALSSERREPAADRVVELLLSRLNGPTLSFASFGHEIDLWPLNESLRKNHSLLLPGRDHIHPSAFAITDFTKQLEKSKKGFLVPKEELCSSFALPSLAFVLVPALYFDSQGGRIGYGGGFYDRLLALLGPETKKIGIGFTEQLALELLPHEAHDMYVDELILV
jgi:5-formyltetrahydrofolate cyclo-ligase